MPVTILTENERLRYERIPVISEETLLQSFYISPEDREFIRPFHGNINKIAVAVQLCLVRFLGHLPNGWENKTDEPFTRFITRQLLPQHGAAIALEDYGRWGKVRTGHLQQILRYLKFRKWLPMDEPTYEDWLLHRGMEHDNERWLLEKFCERLYQDKILRPAIGTLERIVGAVGERLHEETHRRLSFLCNGPLLKKLDGLLETAPSGKMTQHRWLCSAPTANTAKTINQTLDKIVFLKGLGVHQWDISQLPANRKKRLAGIARNNTNSYLQRIKPLRRYPLLVCFLWETLLETTDIVILMYRDFWQQMYAEAKKLQEAERLSLVQLQDMAVNTMAETVRMVIDETIDNANLRKAIFEKQPKQLLLQAVDIASRTSRSINQPLQYYLLPQYGKFKQFTPRFLSVPAFDIAFSKDNFGAALALATQLQTGQKRKLPEGAPANFINKSWGKVMAGDAQRAYELCVLSVLKDRLLSGDVFVCLSKKFADFNSFLIPKERWRDEAGAIARSLGGKRVADLVDEQVSNLSSLLGPLSALLAEGTEIRLEDGFLVAPRIEGEEVPLSVRILQEQINLRLPQLGIVEMIKEVDSWTGFSKEFHDGTNARHVENGTLCHAAFVGNACNLSLADLARSSGLGYQSLWWVANNYFSDENIKTANNLLVNYHHKQWLSGAWGDGTLSSSDGKRFPTSGKIRNAKALPKYFGYGKGVTFYTHTSDQYSQYGIKVISATERDATYVLDEILANETDLEIQEHTTDTHGYSDLLFALFDLVGVSFAPRLRDIKDQRLCKLKEMDLRYPQLKFTGMVSIDYLKKHCDELERVAASLQTGTVTASLLISKLQAYPRQNNLMHVLQAYGQLVKTGFICKYLLELPLRHRINAQLNKGEQLHNLHNYLWFGGDGIIRKKQEQEQQVAARCLGLLTNIVLVWNTVYIQQIILQLRKEGFAIDDEDLKRISPAPFEHINRLGKYDFYQTAELQPDGFRPLRTPFGIPA